MTAPVLDRTVTVPLSRQLSDRLREAVLAGQLRSGFRLPSAPGRARCRSRLMERGWTWRGWRRAPTPDSSM